MNQAQATSPKKALPGGSYILLSLIVAYLMVFTAVPNEITAFFALALPAAFSLIFLRQKSIAITCGVLLLLGIYAGSLISVASLAAWVFIVGMGAIAILRTKPFISIPLAVAAFGISWLVTGNLYVAAATLLPLPAAIALAVCLARKRARTSTVCTVAVTHLLILAIPFLLLLHNAYGGISKEAIFALVDQIQNGIAALLTTVIDEVRPLLPEQITEVLTDSLFQALAELLMYFIPAALIVAVTIPAFFSGAVALSVLRREGNAEKLPLRARFLIMSKISAVLFLLTVLISLISSLVGWGTSDTSIMILLVSGNLMIILLPAFSLTGIFHIIHSLRQKRGCMSVVTIVLLAVMALYGGALVLYPVAAAGAFHTLGLPPLPDENERNS